PSGATLFPQWPAQDPIRAAYVFAASMGLLVLPKLLGYLAALPRRGTRGGMGGIVRGFASVVFETVISALIAPVMMLMQCGSVFDILIGRESGWSPQRRDGTVATADLVRQYGYSTFLGLLLAAGAYAVSTPLLLWMTPVLAGLILSIPVAAFTSSPAVGRGMRAAGLLLTPEERAPPSVLKRANELAADGPAPECCDAVAMLESSDLLDAHLNMLGQPEPRRRGEVDADLAIALAKIDEASDRREAAVLMNAREIFVVLTSRSALQRLFAKPVESRTGPKLLSASAANENE